MFVTISPFLVIDDNTIKASIKFASKLVQTIHEVKWKKGSLQAFSLAFDSMDGGAKNDAAPVLYLALDYG